MREKLIELISFSRNEIEKICKDRTMCTECPADIYGVKCKDEYIAEYLIANGVIIQERGQWEMAGFNGRGDYVECCSNCKSFSVDHDKPYRPICSAKMDI